AHPTGAPPTPAVAAWHLDFLEKTPEIASYCVTPLCRLDLRHEIRRKLRHIASYCVTALCRLDLRRIGSRIRSPKPASMASRRHGDKFACASRPVVRFARSHSRWRSPRMVLSPTDTQ